MALPLDLGGVESPDIRRAFERIGAAWPTPVVCTTAARPPAKKLGRGAMLYDVTLSRPLWSDGTVWRDATGTAA